MSTSRIQGGGTASLMLPLQLLLFGLASVFSAELVLHDVLPNEGLTRSQMNSILASQALDEFDSDEDWHLASLLEWKWAAGEDDDDDDDDSRHLRLGGGRQRQQRRQLDAAVVANSTTRESLLSPFVLCHVQAGKTGYQAFLDIEEFFGTPPVELLPLHNGINMTCFYVSLTAAVAATVQPPLVIHPVIPQVKLERGIFEYIDQSTTRGGGEEEEAGGGGGGGGLSSLLSPPTRFQAMFCPGFVQNNDGDDALEWANQIVNDIRADAQDLNETQVNSNSDRRRRRRYHYRNRRGRELLHQQQQHDDNDKDDNDTDGNSHRPLERELEDTLSTAVCGDMLLGMSVEVDGDVMVLDLDSDKYSKACLTFLVRALSQVSSLCSIHVSREAWVMNTQAQWIVQSGEFVGYRPWFDVGLTGAGQVVAVSDTGLDDSNCYLVDNANGKTPRTDWINATVHPHQRKVIQYVDYADGFDSPMGHGTHVVGTIVGRPVVSSSSSSGSSSSSTTTISADGDGIAPDAKVAFVDIGKSSDDDNDNDQDAQRRHRRLLVPPTMTQLLSPGRKAGAHIFVAAWGSPFSHGMYSAIERQVDAQAFQHAQDLIVVAAGNTGGDGDGDGDLVSLATAKNVLTVGSSQSAGPHDLRRQWDMPGKDFLSWFSSRGPTHDGRHKPDVVAPGEALTSASAGGHCQTHTLAGTSMATAVAAGSAALVRQYYQEGYYPTGQAFAKHERNPSAALVKATLMNGAVPLQGVDTQWWGTQPLQEYDMAQNFGRLQLLHSLPLAGKNEIQALVVDRKVIGSGQVHEYRIAIPSNDDAASSSSCLRQQEANKDLFRATLVWTDPPAAALCKECVLNDLDIMILDSSSKTYFANGRNQPDRKNNAERVRVPFHNNAEGQVFTVQVVAFNLVTPTQEYALIVTGCIEPPPPPRPDEAASKEGILPVKESHHEPAENTAEAADKTTMTVDHHQDDDDAGAQSLPPPSSHSLDPALAGNVQNGPSIPTTTVVAAASVATPPPPPPFGPPKVLSTGFDEGPQAFYGIMFHVVAHQPLRLLGLDIVTYYPWHVVLDHTFSVQVYVMEGDFSQGGGGALHGGKDSSWTLQLTVPQFPGRGTGNATALPKFVTPLEMAAQSQYSLYVAMPHPDLAITFGLDHNLPFGSVVASSSDGALDILSGIALEHDFGNWYADYIFNGALHYQVL